MSNLPLVERSPCDASNPLRIAVFVSGNGSNLQTLIDATKEKNCPFKINLVVSNKPAALALERARKARIKSLTLMHSAYSCREDFERDLLKACVDERIELVVLAGFMRVLGSTFLKPLENKVINLHPALCPAFPGLNAVRQALNHGVWFTGCTVHIVNEGVDTGPIIAQSVVPIFRDDDEESLSKRLHLREHQLLKSVVLAISQGRDLREMQPAQPDVYRGELNLPINC